VWMLGLLALLAIGVEPRSPWDRVLLGVVGLAFCVEGIDAIRTARAEFRFSIWYGFEATRREQPVRFWIYCVLNFTLGGWVLAVSVFSVNPNGQALSIRHSTSHGVVGVVSATAGRAPDPPPSLPASGLAADHLETDFGRQAKRRPNRRLQPAAASAIMGRRG
jgi:hypothetical protein